MDDQQRSGTVRVDRPSIGELNGNWARWFKVVLSVLVPAITILLVPTVKMLHGLDNRLGRIEERIGAIGLRITNVEGTNESQWETIAVQNLKIQDLTTFREETLRSISRSDDSVRRLWEELRRKGG